MVRISRVLIVLAAASLLLSACTVKKTERPALAGPSELALSLNLSANPDLLTQDGSAQSRIVILALDQNGAPVKGLPLHISLAVNQQVTSAGQLSTQDVTTGNDGRAAVSYTAPPAPADSSDKGVLITVFVTPVGTNYASAVPRSVDIRLVPPGVVTAAPIAWFSYSPTMPVPNAPVSFDASGSRCDGGTLTAWSWDYGDNTTGSGVKPQHTYRTAGDYTVSLVVTDDRGRTSNAFKQTVSVASTRPPSADFVISPTSPSPGQTVYFNASASSASAGRTLADFAWDFGNGKTAHGATVTSSYDAAGTYNVTLVVTDDVGQTATKSQPLTVSSSGTGGDPVATFVFSPSTPAVSQALFFDASQSKAFGGHTISSYAWNFGDGTTASGKTVTKAAGYASAGTYTVVLTVTDDAGKTGTVTNTVTVSGGASGNPTTAFVYSPAAPAVGADVFFDASGSTAPSGHSITSYMWAFGDGTGGSGRTFTKAGGYTSAASYSVVLTITDDLGHTSTATQQITVGAAVTPKADFSISPSPAPVGATVTVDASTSTTSVGQTIVKYEFIWGDGPGVTTVLAPSRTSQHVYATAGIYTITLTITDSAGRTAATSKTVTIQ